jgi:hypothetical protein
MRSQVSQRNLEYGEAMAERFPQAKNNYSDLSEFGLAMATALRYFNKDLSSDKKGKKFKSIFNTRYLSSAPFYASIGMTRDFERFNGQEESKRNYNSFALKLRKYLKRGFR